MEQFSDILNTFFEGTFERPINEQMFYRDYAFPDEDVLNYAYSIINTPTAHFISYIRDNRNIPFLEYNDIVQFSSLSDATSGIVSVLEANGDEGFTFIDLGKLLLNDGKIRNDVAYRKYGENHTKTAQEFGLTQVLYCKTYLTCIGKILNKLDVGGREKLLRRLIMRNRYIQLMIKLSATERLTLDSQMVVIAPK